MLSNFSTYLHTYSFIRSDRVYGRGGDVGIMIHNDFRIISSNCLVFSYSDGLYITLKSSNDIIFKIIVIYRPPNNDFTSFFNEFSDLVINSNIYNTIFVGDFNFHYGSLISPHIMSRIHYCCSLYYGLPATSTKYLDRIIRSSIRVLHRVKLYDHESVNYRLVNYKWLNMNQNLPSAI